MRRTQIYLTDEEREALQVISRHLGQSQSELIRKAVDRYIEEHQEGNRLDFLRRGRGIWKNRKDLPDFESLRQELDRSPTES